MGFKPGFDPARNLAGRPRAGYSRAEQNAAAIGEAIVEALARQETMLAELSRAVVELREEIGHEADV